VAARDVQLELPETGVCSSSNAADTVQAEAGCCGAEPSAKRGLATGIQGGLLSLPLVTLGAASSSDGCCG
jgi:hypothetical protein